MGFHFSSRCQRNLRWDSRGHVSQQPPRFGKVTIQRVARAQISGWWRFSISMLTVVFFSSPYLAGLKRLFGYRSVNVACIYTHVYSYHIRLYMYIYIDILTLTLTWEKPIFCRSDLAPWWSPWPWNQGQGRFGIQPFCVRLFLQKNETTPTNWGIQELLMCVGDVSFGVTCRAGNTFRYLGRTHGSTEATGIAPAATAGGELNGWQSKGVFPVKLGDGWC